MAITRRTRWAQFLLLTLSYLLALCGWLAWLYYSEYEWWVNDLGVAGGIMLVIILTGRSYHWLLGWEVEWTGKTPSTKP